MSLQKCASDDSPAATAATASATDATSSGTDTAGSTVKGAANSLSTILGQCKDQLVESGSEVIGATNGILKAVGQVSIAGVGLLLTAWNTISLTTAKIGVATASGVETINDKITSHVPVIGTITTGASNVITGATKTFSTNAEFNTEQRQHFVNDLRTKLHQYQPGPVDKPPATGNGADAASAATPAAASPPAAAAA